MFSISFCHKNNAKKIIKYNVQNQPLAGLEPAIPGLGTLLYQWPLLRYAQHEYIRGRCEERTA